jgi:hypothetical protein
MSVTSIPTILTLPNNCPIESVQGTIVEVYKGRNVAGGKHVQDAKLRDGSGAEIKLTIWEHPDISTLTANPMSTPSQSRKPARSNTSKSITPRQEDKVTPRQYRRMRREHLVAVVVFRALRDVRSARRALEEVESELSRLTEQRWGWR